MTALFFDEATHVYRWDGKPVPNVTSIIKHLSDYSMIPADKLEKARQEGVALHKMVELDCKNDLNVASLPDWLKPFHQAWCEFKVHTGIEVWSAERRMYHPDLGYAGTSDIAGVLPKIKWPNTALIDLKRSFTGGPAIGVQLAAYKDSWNRNDKRRINRRFALRLRPGEPVPYQLLEYKDQDDHAMFLACLTQLKWKEKHYGRN